jgi:hypothetical protein
MRIAHIALFGAALGLACLSSGLAASARPSAGLGQAYPQVCAPGYHVDAGGNCQPNIAQENRFCAPGLVYEPSFYGWYCAAPPPEAY